MKPYVQSPPTTLVIFGAGGDLTARKLVPALYNLSLDNWLPSKLAIIGVDLKEMSDEQFRQYILGGVNKFSRRGKAEENEWNAFAPKMSFIRSDLVNPELFSDLKKRFSDIDKGWGTTSNKIFYLAIPPSVIQTVAEQIGKARLADDREHNRIVVEKPFGHDLQSARELNSVLRNIFDESQIYRIDHYLGKETVQNILAFRFANSLFEPIWNRRYIDHIQITVAEQIGVEHRGAYYEHAGALRDMVQNHLLQLMCLIAMEPPVSYHADEIRNKKVDVLNAIRTITPEQVPQLAVRGQYDSGWIEGENVKAYREEESVNRDSNIETFAAIKYFVDNWRWQDVPFYIRTGKRLPSKVSDIVIQFRPVPHQSFPTSAMIQPQPNLLVIRIQPQEGIHIRFQAKQPGETMRLNPVEMKFSYREAFRIEPPDAYETLLLDVMLADSTQFMRADQLEVAWSVITPILDVWDSVTPADFPNYAAGSWGPEEAEVVIAQDGRAWHLPHVQEEEKAEE
jgi:glucose-6-phosphate 1-dehydrogenase